MSEYKEILDKISTVDKNVGIAANEIKHISDQVHSHIETYERHKEDYYKWRRKVDSDRGKAITECPVEKAVEEKISRKSAYRMAGFVLLVIGIIEGVIQFFKGE